MTLSPEDLKYLEPEFQKLAELERDATDGKWLVKHWEIWRDSPGGTHAKVIESLPRTAHQYGLNARITDLELTAHSRNQLKPLLTALITERKRVEELEEAISIYALPALVAHGIDAGLDMETIKNRTAYKVCAKAILKNKGEG